MTRVQPVLATTNDSLIGFVQTEKATQKNRSLQAMWPLCRAADSHSSDSQALLSRRGVRPKLPPTSLRPGHGSLSSIILSGD